MAEDQADQEIYVKSRRAAMAVMSYVPTKRSGYGSIEVPDGGTYKDAASKVGIVEGRDVATWASTVQCQE